MVESSLNRFRFMSVLLERTQPYYVRASGGRLSTLQPRDVVWLQSIIQDEWILDERCCSKDLHSLRSYSYNCSLCLIAVELSSAAEMRLRLPKGKVR